MPRLSLLCITAIATLASGCTVGPDFKSPESSTTMPVDWIGTTQPSEVAATQPTTQESIAISQSPTDVALWWTHFDDPTLDSLVDRAIESNLDLQRTAARIREARALRQIVSSALYPEVNSSGAYRRTRGSGSSGGPFDGSNDFFEAGLDAAWEIDVFGGTRRNVEAANADIQAAIEDRRDVLVTLVSEVALNYLDLRTFQRQIGIANDNLEAQIRSLDLTERRKNAGFVGSLDLAQAQAQVATTRAQIPSLEAAARQTIYAIAVLLALEPAVLLDELQIESPIPATPPVVPIGLPSELLRRRPDIRRAEAQLHGATARIGVATAELFPRFALNGSFGLAGQNFSDLGDWSNRFWSFGPTISWPIFTAGRIQANIQVQDEREEQALLTYRQTVLIALQEVESSLIAFEKEQFRRAALLDAVDASRRAVDISTLLYTQGRTAFLDVLTAQRSLLGAEDALAQSDRAVAANLVALYKALGGGWEGETDEGAEPTMQPE